MTFNVSDLMVDVLPDVMQEGGCGPSTTAPAPPCPDPSCNNNSAPPKVDEGAGVKLAPLAALRNELRRALQP
jgi:hypothetical protein